MLHIPTNPFGGPGGGVRGEGVVGFGGLTSAEPFTSNALFVRVYSCSSVIFAAITRVNFRASCNLAGV